MPKADLAFAQLARIVEDVCLFGISPDRDVTKGKAAKVAKTVIKVLEDKIRRDGRVTIRGLGRFYVYTKPAFRKYCLVTHQGNLKNAIRDYIDLPEAKWIKFKPCESLWGLGIKFKGNRKRKYEQS